MKKILIWLGIVIGTIALLILCLIAYVLISHDRYGFYASGGLLSENQANFDVLYYGLNLEIFAEEEAIAGSVDLKIRSLVQGLKLIEMDLIDNFDVSKINDQQQTELVFKHEEDKLLITLDKPVPRGEIIDLCIYYEGQPVEAIFPPWIGGFNWSKDSSRADWIGLSCQGEGAKIWFPCKDHPSDKPDSVALNITIPEPYYCAANGILRTITRPKQGFQTYHWITHYPINNYNINISIGQYEILQKEYITEQGSRMPVYFYYLPQSKNGAERHLDMAIDMLYTYRKYYGEYPFANEKFAIVETDYLGMEHQTINAYGNNYNYEQVDSLDWDWLMLHEMGHEWWGNKVTMKDWADLWIHEGICTYGEALYLREKGGETAYHDHIMKLQAQINNKKPIIPKRNADSQEVYSGDIYMKGAYLMHTLRYLLGDSTFFRMLKEFANDPKYTYQNLVQTDDFIELIAKYAEIDYSAFINDYLYTIHLPKVQVDTLTENRYAISIPNIEYVLPMEVTLSDGIRQLHLSKNPVLVSSMHPPIVDESEWFLKEDFSTRSRKVEKLDSDLTPPGDPLEP